MCNYSLKNGNAPAPYSIRKCVVKFNSLLGVAALLAVVSACAPQIIEVPVEVPVEVSVVVPECELRNFNQGSTYLTEAWGVPDNRFNVGEPLNLQMQVSSPSYMTIFYVSTSCKVTRLLYNKPVALGEIIDFPHRDSGLRMTVKPPTGEEKFYFVATRKKLIFLSDTDVLREVNGIASLDMSPEQFYARLEQVQARTNPAGWNITTLSTSVIGH